LIAARTAGPICPVSPLPLSCAQCDTRTLAPDPLTFAEELAERVRLAHVRAEAAHRRAAVLHRDAAVLFDRHGKPEQADRERAMADMQLAGAASELAAQSSSRPTRATAAA
jgi:hypothetical protein